MIDDQDTPALRILQNYPAENPALGPDDTQSPAQRILGNYYTEAPGMQAHHEVADYLQEHAARLGSREAAQAFVGGRPSEPWPEVAANIRQQWPDVDPEHYRDAYLQARRGHQIDQMIEHYAQEYRDRMGDQHEVGTPAGRRLARGIASLIPFGRQTFGIMDQRRLAEANRNIADGHPTHEDLRIAGEYRAIHEEEGSRTFGQRLGHAVLDLGPMTLEMLMGGRLATAIAGPAAAGTSAYGMPQLTARALAAPVAGWVGRSALQAGTVGGLAALESAHARAVPELRFGDQGIELQDRGQWYSARNLIPAYGEQAVMMAIGNAGIQRMLRQETSAGLRGFIGHTARSGLEMTTAQAINGMAGWSSDYGPFGAMWNGDYGRGAQDLAINFVAAAVLSAPGLLPGEHPGQRSAAALEDTLNADHRRGTSRNRAFTTAGEITRWMVDTGVDNPEMTRQQVQDAINERWTGRARDYATTLADQVVRRPEPPTVPQEAAKPPEVAQAAPEQPQARATVPQEAPKPPETAPEAKSEQPIAQTMPHHEALIGKAKSAIDANPALTPEQKQAYHAGFSEVVGRMAPEHAQAVNKAVRNVKVFESPQALTDAYQKSGGRKIEGGVVAGVWRGRTGELWIDGPTDWKGRSNVSETYAHELGHVVGRKLSRTQEWADIWKEEMSKGQLSKIASGEFGGYDPTQLPREGFAEFFRLVNAATHVPMSEIQARFPKAFDYFQRKGLIPENRPETGGTLQTKGQGGILTDIYSAVRESKGQTVHIAEAAPQSSAERMIDRMRAKAAGQKPIPVKTAAPTTEGAGLAEGEARPLVEGEPPQHLASRYDALVEQWKARDYSPEDLARNEAQYRTIYKIGGPDGLAEWLKLVEKGKTPKGKKQLAKQEAETAAQLKRSEEDIQRDIEQQSIEAAKRRADASFRRRLEEHLRKAEADFGLETAPQTAEGGATSPPEKPGAGEAAGRPPRPDRIEEVVKWIRNLAPAEVNNVIQEIERQNRAGGTRLTPAEVIGQAYREANAQAERAALAEVQANASGGSRAAAAGGVAEPTPERPGAGQPAGVAAGELAAGPTESLGAAGRGEGLSQPQIIKTIETLFDLPIYREKIGDTGHRAYYQIKPEGVVLSHMEAGQAPVIIHELAHHLDLTLKLIGDGSGLPEPVLDGLASWDYAPGKHRFIVQLREGLAEYLRMRLTDKLPPDMTAEQSAAAKWIEGKLAEHPEVLKKLDRIGKMVQEHVAQEPWRQYAGNVIATDKATASPEGLTRAETIAEIAEKAQRQVYDRVIDDLGPLARMSADVRKRGGKPEPGATAEETMRASRARSAPMAEEYRREGFYAYNKDGERVRLGESEAKAIEGMTPEEMKAGGKMDAFMHARQDVHDWENNRQHEISREDYLSAKAALDDLAKDKDFMARAVPAATRITRELFNASLRAMAMAGRFTAEQVERAIALRPYYVPRTRVMEHMEPRARPMSERKGSAEQRVSVMDAIADRRAYTAWVINKQMQDMAFYRMVKDNPGLAKYAIFKRLQLSDKGRAEMAKYKALGLPEHEIAAIWDRMGDKAKDFYTPESWGKDDNRLTYTMWVDGEAMRARIGDKSLYDLLMHSQGDGEVATKLINGINVISAPLAKLQRLGFTALSVPWHVLNLISGRDLYKYLQRTVSQKGTLANIRDYIAETARSAKFNWLQLIGSDPSADKWHSFYRKLTGHELDAMSQAGIKPVEALDGIKGWFRRLTDLASSAETAGRVAEFKNMAKELGITESDITEGRVTYPQEVALINAAARISHNTQQMGYNIRMLNKGIPFLGAHIAGLTTDIAALRSKPLQYSMPLAVLAAMKLANWYMHKDDQNYKELSPRQRNGFFFNTPIGPVVIPAPRGIDAPVLGIIDELLRSASRSDPNFGSLVHRTLEPVIPQSGPAGFTQAAELLANRRQLTEPYPIVPRRAENAPASEQWTQYRVPWLAEQLGGGGNVRIGETGLGGIVRNPLPVVATPHQSLNDYYDRLHELTTEREAARKRGSPFEGEGEYRRLHYYEERLNQLNRELRGEVRMQGRNRPREQPTAQRREEIHREMVDLARRALGRDTSR